MWRLRDPAGGVEDGLEAAFQVRGPGGFYVDLELTVQGGAGDALERQERSLVAQRVHEILGRVLGNLDPEDRLLLKMHFRDGFKVSEIGRTLGRNQRRLYTTLAKMFRQLKSSLAEEGLEAQAALSAIGWDGWDGLLDDPSEGDGAE